MNDVHQKRFTHASLIKKMKIYKIDAEHYMKMTMMMGAF